MNQTPRAFCQFIPAAIASISLLGCIKNDSKSETRDVATVSSDPRAQIRELVDEDLLALQAMAGCLKDYKELFAKPVYLLRGDVETVNGLNTVIFEGGTKGVMLPGVGTTNGIAQSLKATAKSPMFLANWKCEKIPTIKHDGLTDNGTGNVSQLAMAHLSTIWDGNMDKLEGALKDSSRLVSAKAGGTMGHATYEMTIGKGHTIHTWTLESFGSFNSKTFKTDYTYKSTIGPDHDGGIANISENR